MEPLFHCKVKKAMPSFLPILLDVFIYNAKCITTLFFNIINNKRERPQVGISEEIVCTYHNEFAVIIEG